MAASKIATVLLVAIAMAGIFLPGNRVIAEDCDKNMQDLKAYCSNFVKVSGPQLTPSLRCCTAVQETSIPCLCSKVTKELEQMVDMGKVAYVAKYCGKPLQHGMKCGSYTVPKA